MLKGTDLSNAIYGGIFNIDNAGSSPGIELFNFIYGVTENDMLSPDRDICPTKYGHHIARKLAHGDLEADITENMLQGENAEIVLGKLFASLQIQPPNIKRTTDAGWTRKPFFPFTKSLIHWDIRKNGKIERVWMRGGGALLHKILRKDDDLERLKRIKLGFINLYSLSEGSSLHRLSAFFRSENAFSPLASSSIKPDEVERNSRANVDDFESTYRDGVLNILEHKRLTNVGKIESLVNWSGLWLALMQYRRSCDALEYYTPLPIVCDCALHASPIRRLARKQFQRAFSTIKTALDDFEQKKYKDVNEGQKNKIRGFFPSTASGMGLLNAYTGSRYFTLKIIALETIVAALVPAEDEMPFSEFVDKKLYIKLGIVVSRGAAKSAGLLEEYDGTLFEENEHGLGVQMKAAGLLTTYSDATKMISIKR